MTDIDIASKYKMKNIEEIGKKLNLKDLDLYGKYKAKINFENIKNKKLGKLILVTAITPTKMGEGKTTVSIGLCDALNSLGKKACLALREPSMGPVFGVKGGATGGGKSQIVPMEDINLHFNGDFHAITAANNLLCAAIDNHIFQDNKLNIDPKTICFNRCLDVNDRILRNIKLENREEHFQITAASEIMTILCLAKDYKDLQKRLDNILVGFTFDKKPVYAKDLKVSSALAVILKEALKPNLVQTLYGNPAIVHGGPFANISIGCNSLIATKTALKLSDIVVTEAGFGSDLGAEKFLDIKCRAGSLKPNAIVLVVTCRALQFSGLENLQAHLDNLQQFSVPIVVAINKFNNDKEEDINKIIDFCNENNVDAKVTTAYINGDKGAQELALKVLEKIKLKNNFHYLYKTSDTIEDKLLTLVEKIYHANKIEYSSEALKKIEIIKKIGKENLPICVAKTQYSISDDSNKIGYPKDYPIYVKDIKIYSGAEFIVVLLGNILTLPGLSKKPAFENIKLDKNNNIKGIF